MCNNPFNYPFILWAYLDRYPAHAYAIGYPVQYLDHVLISYCLLPCQSIAQ